MCHGQFLLHLSEFISNNHAHLISINFRLSPCILTINHFYYPTNALHYIKLRYQNLHCVSFKRQLKITATCFWSCAIHLPGVLSCAWLKLLLVVLRYFSCAWPVFGSVILNLRCVCVCVCVCTVQRAF